MDMPQELENVLLAKLITAKLAQVLILADAMDANFPLHYSTSSASHFALPSFTTEPKTTSALNALLDAILAHMTDVSHAYQDSPLKELSASINALLVKSKSTEFAKTALKNNAKSAIKLRKTVSNASQDSSLTQLMERLFALNAAVKDGSTTKEDAISVSRTVPNVSTIKNALFATKA
jgi:hypothetical protein